MYPKKLFPFFLLLFLCPFVVQATIPAAERNALMALYSDTNGAGWTDSSNWTTGDPCANHWYGITCDLANTMVTKITLEGNNLIGAIPTELGSLINLKTLWLKKNQLAGTIPRELGNLSDLVSLSLAENELSGNIPSELGNLASLENLSLNRNLLTSNIPISLGNLASLSGLYLGRNELSGSIPASLGNILSLQYLWLDNNQLTGSIPKELGNLSNLKTLALYRNELTNNIPKELGNLSSLLNLFFGDNQLADSIPKELGYLINLNWLGLSKNQLTGKIPAELTKLINLAENQLNLSYNALYTTNTALDAFLDSKQSGGNWSITQTVAPANVTLDSFTANSASLQWDLIEYTQNNGSYQVYSSTNGASYVYDSDATADKSTDGYTFTGLSTTGNNYCFVVRTVTEPHPSNSSRLESNDSNQVCIINGEIDADGDGLGDDTEDRDACYTASLTLLAGEEYQGIGNTTLSSTDSIITENTGTIKTLAPHQLILKAPEVQIMTGLTFSVESGAGFIISSQPDVCP